MRGAGTAVNRSVGKENSARAMFILSVVMLFFMFGKLFAKYAFPVCRPV